MLRVDYKIKSRGVKEMKRIFAFIMTVIMLLSMFNTLAIASEIFPDLAIQQFDARGKPLRDRDTGDYIYEDHWACKDIRKSTKIGIIDGYYVEDENIYVFKPDQAITKAEFIKMAMILSTNRTFDFDSVPVDINHWAGKYVKVAEMQNVIEKGAFTDKNLNEPITRIEMICLLSKIQINMKGVEQNRRGNLQYIDIDKLTQEEKDLLLHAAKYVLIEGMLDSNKFMPEQNLTRAEATVAIMRIY